MGSPGEGVEEWGDRRLPDVMAVVDAALPAERLTEDEVGTILFDDPDPTLVVGVAGDSGPLGVAAAVLRTAAGGGAGEPRVHVQLVAVDPAAQRAGHGGALLAAVHRWAFDTHGVGTVVAGAGAPFYLWPGVDVHATGAHCLFEAFGYRTERGYLDLSFTSRFRAPAPAGIELRRVLDDAQADAVLAFVSVHWPSWVAECRRGVEHGACHAAFDVASGAVVAFGCHSVNRLGVLGPIGTDPACRGTGIGRALLGVIATDVMAAGIEQVQVSWIGPHRFYAKTAGATTSRAYLNLVLRRPSPPSA